MPVNLRRTLLFASALQVLGPKHDFTVMMERLLSGYGGDDPEDTILERLADNEKTALLDQTIFSGLPLNSAAGHSPASVCR